jgi:7,8-didemethyl-8-hydroxy-5-deazariboflavin synthase CofG subunit
MRGLTCRRPDDAARSARFVDLTADPAYTSPPLPDDTSMAFDRDSARIIAGAARGAGLTLPDAYALVRCDDDVLPMLLAAAGAVRDRGKGRTVTYSRKVFLPITNLCRDRCSYCTFRKDPDDPGAWTMTRAEIAEWVARARRQGCKEALMCLGDRPEAAFPSHRETLRALGHDSTIAYVREACEIALAAGLLPHTNAGLLTSEEMRLLRPVNASLGLMLENVSPRLRARGMPHQHAPDKEPARRLTMIAEAGRLRIPFTTGILLGIGETPEERVDSLFAIADLHAAYGHIQEVIVQNFRSKPNTPMATASEPGAADLARTIAVARLLLGPDVNIQAPPNLSPGDHRLLLRAGINDWGGISPVSSDYVNPEAAWPVIGTLARTCAEEGFVLRERLTIYPEYVHPRYLDPDLATLVDRLAEVIRTEDVHADGAH